jgi:hypothetical protein
MFEITNEIVELCMTIINKKKKNYIFLLTQFTSNIYHIHLVDVMNE